MFRCGCLASALTMVFLMEYNFPAVIAANQKEVVLLAAYENISATVTTKGDKYYVVVTYYLDGKRKQKRESTGLSVSGNNKRKAEIQKKALIKKYEGSPALPENQLFFHDFMKQWPMPSKWNTLPVIRQIR